jgi:hypothetical protein
MVSSDNGNGSFTDEWKACRGILGDYDGRLHELRKYGFSFLTALLSAESILIPSIPSLVASGKVLPDSIKCTVLIVNLMLIVLLRLMDRNYQVFQSAAASRALVRERTLNFELTEVISQRYDDNYVRQYVTVLYGAFTGGVLFLGLSVLDLNYLFMGILGVAWGVALFLILILGRHVKVNYPYGPIDWTIERLECKQGEKVGITLTNLSGKYPLKFVPSDIMWELKTEDGTPLEKKGTSITLEKPLQINKSDSHTWLLPTEGLEEGVYRVWRIVIVNGHKQLKPLLRKLRVHQAKS